MVWATAVLVAAECPVEKRRERLDQNARPRDALGRRGGELPGLPECGSGVGAAGIGRSAARRADFGRFVAAAGGDSPRRRNVLLGSAPAGARGWKNGDRYGAAVGW